MEEKKKQEFLTEAKSNAIPFTKPCIILIYSFILSHSFSLFL